MRYLLFVILLFSVEWPTLAQEPVVYDSSFIYKRDFSAEKIKVFKNDRHFQYDKIMEPPRSWLQRLQDWILGRIARLFSNKGAANAFNWFIVILSVFIILFFIIKLTGMTGTGLFGKKNKGENLPYHTGEENIHTIHFEEAIRQAIERRNFRLAVRLLYLQSLKELADKGLINWQVNKTNIAYVRELQGTNYYQHFGHLTFQFENNWYGDLPISETEFANVSDQFNQFNQKLK
jgi:hypothetical protein